MAWPSTKAGTTHVDAGSDSPSSARSDIKQNIDNVNAIIDEFDIASPSNGDILTYNSTSGAWEPGAASAGGTNIAVLQTVTTGWELVSGNDYRRYLDETFDNGGIVSLNGNYQFTLGAGTYLFKPDHKTVDDNEASIILYNETDASAVKTFVNDEISTVGEGLFSGVAVFTITGNTNFSIRQTSVGTPNRDSQLHYYIYK